MERDINNFLDIEGRIKSWPSKMIKKKEVLHYLSCKFELNRTYTEKEVNDIISEWHTFGDLFILRRGMIDMKFLRRTRDGSSYWREEILLPDNQG